MEQYIIKDAVVAEIGRRIKINNGCMLGFKNLDYYQGKVDALNDTLSFLNTLEVKEVDLKNELKEDWLFADKIEVDCLESMCLTEDMFASLAKKYFELGIKAQK